MELGDQRAARRRRILLPLVVLVAAAGIAIWGSRRELNRIDESRTMVLGLCKLAAAGEDVSKHINADPFVAARVADSLRLICSEPDALPDLKVEVFSGDLDEQVVGSAAEEANFSAIIRDSGGDRLGLRLRHEGDARRIIVLGYWVP